MQEEDRLKNSPNKPYRHSESRVFEAKNPVVERTVHKPRDPCLPARFAIASKRGVQAGFIS